MTALENEGNVQNLPAVATPKVEDTQTAKVLPLDPKDDDMGLQFFKKEFIYETMAIPSISGGEGRLVNYVKFFAMQNGIDFDFDDYGNIYLTKGKLEEGEYYPCVTSHLDSVQTYQSTYAYASVNLQLKTERIKESGKHKLYVDKIGIGADDKGGICICLAMFEHVDKLKACFFLEEETGCQGSNKLNKDWFDDVAYVIGYDSPELNRAAWACSGVKLFSYAFYEKYMKPVCDKWGMTRFESEPFTDVKIIREKIGVICMNFGNGGYLAHNTTSEYSIIEEMDHALGMGIDLVKSIGCVRYTMPSNTEYVRSDATVTSSTGEVIKADNYEDSDKLRKLGKYSYNYGAGSVTGYTGGTTYRSNQSSDLTKKREGEIRMETLKYIVARYDGHIEDIKGDILDTIKEICKENELDFGLFEEKVTNCFSNEIKF